LALVANEIAVGAISFQVLFQIATSDLHLFACSAGHLFFGAGLPVSILLHDFEGRTAARVGALDHTELALFENVRGVVLVRDLLHLARVEGAGERGTLKKGLHHRVAVVHNLHGLVATLARVLLLVVLTCAANQLSALFAIASINRDEVAVRAES